MRAFIVSGITVFVVGVTFIGLFVAVVLRNREVPQVTPTPPAIVSPTR